MKLSHLTSGLLVSAFLASAAYAGECVMTVTRTACAGKETESYSKCNGKQTCNVTKDTASADACLKVAVESCQNKRTAVTQNKKVIATFSGKTLDGGKDICASKAEGYDPDQAYPYRAKAECK